MSVPSGRNAAVKNWSSMPRNSIGPVLHERLALVSGNAQLLVLQQIQFAAGFVVDGDELRGLVNALSPNPPRQATATGSGLPSSVTETSTVIS